MADQVYVFDACAVIALLQHEEGAAIVEQMLTTPGTSCLVHAINACEVYYDLYRRTGKDSADRMVRFLPRYGLVIDSTITEDFWKRVGELKGQWRRVSLADCFAIALTLRESATLVTTDHRELDAISAAKVCTIRFIR